MNTKTRIRVALVGAALLLLVGGGPAAAQKSGQPASGDGKTPNPATRKEDAYEVLFNRYLDSSRQAANDERASYRWMAGLGSDFRARDINDLVTINVVESITAIGTADSALNKKSTNAASLGKFFGLDTKLPSFMDPTSLASPSNASDFKGGGTTSRSGTLTATMTARVVEVMPNGDLVLEGVREIEINGDRQLVVLTGSVRRADLAPDNSVYSTRVGQMRIRYFGNGQIKDTLSPGWLVRLLNKIF